MIISQLFLIWFYFINIVLFFNFNRPFIFWLITEINLLLFISIMWIFIDLEFKHSFQDLMLFYFIIQSLSSIFILRDFFLILDFFTFNSNLLFIIAILVKLAIFPFFFWIFKMGSYLNSISLTFILRIQKIPFFLVLFNSINFLVLVFIIFSMIAGSIMILYRKNLVFMLICSSVIYRFWIFYIYNIRLFFFILFFLFYSILIFLVLTIERQLFFNSKGWFYLLIFIFFLGLSPMRLFFFKFYVVNILYSNYDLIELLIFWTFRFISLFGYIKFSHKRFFKKLEVVNTIKSSEIFKSIFWYVRLIFFFFCIYY